MNKTPLFASHVALGARMAPFGGWDMPIQYAGILAEHLHTRQATAVFDICHMGEFEISGAAAATDLERLLTQNIRGLAIGQCRYGYLLREDGGVLDDLTCYRLGEDRYMLVVNAATCAKDAAWIRSRLSAGTQFRDISAQTAKLDVQGPTARADLEGALGVQLPELKYFYAAPQELRGAACLVSRTGYTGEWGYELYLPWERAVEFWELLLQHPRIKPAGLGARDTLRLEMGYPLYGHELSEAHSPLGAARGSFVDMEKDFVGKPALQKELQQGVPRYLAGLVLQGRRAARAQDAVFSGSLRVGEATSGSFAPSLNVAVALAYVDQAVSAPGTLLEIESRGVRLPAVVAPLPLYKNGTARKKTGG